MSDVERTPLAEWRKRDDGSWEPVPTLGRGISKTLQQIQNPGGPWLEPGDVFGDDNILVTEFPDGRILIRRGGHAVLYQGVESPWRDKLDFTGAGVDVSDAADRTIVTIPGASQEGLLRWRGAYDVAAFYIPGDVVWFEDALFIFTELGVSYGYGYGPYGGGPYGATPGLGFGTGAYGYGPYGGS